MKHIKNLIIFALIFTFFAIGCEKEKTIEQDINKSPTNNSSNPFDTNHGYLEIIFQDVLDFFSEIEENPNYEDFDTFMNDFEILIEEYQRNNPYPKFDITKYNKVKQKNFEDLMEDYLYNIQIDGLEEATNQIEIKISLLSDQDLQQDMYAVVSQSYFAFSFLDDMEDLFIQRGKLKDWWNKFDDCMKKPKDWNPVDWAFCLSTGVGCPLYMMASCAWDVTFN